MDFQGASYGVDIMGINQYISDLNTAILTKVSNVIRNTSEVETEVKAGWVGQSADQFLLNLNKAADTMCDTLKELEKTFEAEIKGIKDQMTDFDDTLVDAE